MTYPNPFSKSAPLRLLADDLDPSPQRQRQARDRYTDLGDFINEHVTETIRWGVRVYPQGSFPLGTTTRDPFTDEFDVDLVFHIDGHKSATTQDDLKKKVGKVLDIYTAWRHSEGSPLAPSGLEEGSRAWTLLYGDNFHMDVLPVAAASPGDIPHTLGTPEWLTDRDYRNWLATNPSGLAEWFKGLTHTELRKRAAIASVKIDDLPPEQAKSSLQRVVQILKRHRDHAFQDDEDGLAPPSVLITVLAGLAYARAVPDGGDVEDVLQAIIPVMPEFLQHEAGELWLPNPTCGDENYADRYGNRPEKEKALYAWLEAAQRDFEDLLDTKGLDVLEKRLDRVFGTGYGGRVARRVGEELRSGSQAGALFTSTTGGLSTAATGRPSNPRHTFYGEKP